MSLNTAILLWIGFAAVDLNPVVAFVGKAPCLNAPVLTGRQYNLVLARTTCSPSIANAPPFFLCSNDRMAQRIRKLPNQPKMTMLNAESDSIRQPVEKPISQAHFKETIHTLFEQIDMDGNGIIDLEEIQNLADSIGYSETDEAQMKHLVESMDTDGDGKIDFADFLAWYTRHSSPTEDSPGAKIIALLRRKTSRDKALALFQRIDTDRSGAIDAKELMTLCTELGYRWTPEQAEKVLASMAPGAATVDFEAFFAWYAHDSEGADAAAAAAGAAELRGALRRDPQLDERRVLVRGFPQKADEGAVKRFFERAGGIDGVQMLPWSRDGRPSGRCVLTFAARDGAEAALRMHRRRMGPRWLEVYRVNCGDSEERVPLDPALHGAVLGVGGRTLQRIESETGARLYLHVNGTAGRLLVKGTEEERRAAKARVKAAVEGDTPLRIPIESSMAGLIIGAGGRTKARIEKESGARMQVKNADADSAAVYTRTVVELRGPAAATARAYGLIMDELEAATEDRRDLHPKYHGNLMGRQGATVNALQAETGTRIRFVRGPDAGHGPDAGAVFIRGPPANRLRAWELLLAVREALPPALALLRAGAPVSAGALRSRPEFAGPVGPEEVWPLAVAEALHAARLAAADNSPVQL